MIPNINILQIEITNKTHPTKTYKINFDPSVEHQLSVLSQPVGVDRISGYIDGLPAVIQAIYLILCTERFKYNIYSWNYGVELLDLIGKPLPYVMAELPRRIREALTMDDRIDDVVDFEFESRGKRLHTKFTVVTNIGNISTAMEVAV